MREIAYLNDAVDARETRTDWYTARVVAMLVAVNSKRQKYQPAKWMLNGKELMREARERRKPLTGEECLERFRRLGVPIIDMRQKASIPFAPGTAGTE